MTSVSLGELVIDLVLGSEGIEDQFAQIYEQGLTSANRMEGLFGGLTPPSPKDLHLAPTVDLSGLHELNRVFDSKGEHATRLQNQFDRKPLTPKVDLSQLDALEKDYGLDLGDKKIKLEVDIKQAKRPISKDKQNEALGGRISSGMKDAVSGMGENFAKHVGDAVKDATPRPGLFGKISSSLIAGAVEPLTANLGNGLSRGIDVVLSDVIGSTELLGISLSKGLLSSESGASAAINKLFEGIIEDLPEVVQGQIKFVRDEIAQGISEDLSAIGDVVKSGIAHVVGDDAVITESLRVQGQDRKRQQSNLSPARDEIAAQRRDRFRDVEFRQSELNQVKANAQRQKTKVENGEALEATIKSKIEGIEFSLKLADEDEADKLNDKLSMASEELADLSGWIAQNRLSLIDMDAAVRPAKDALTASINAVKEVDEQFKSLKAEEFPRIFREALSAVTDGQSIDESLIPRLVVDNKTLDKRGSKATFDIDSNSVIVRQELHDALQSGTATADQIQSILHELQHAFDFDFGSFEGIEALGRNELLRPRDAAVPTLRESDELVEFLNKYSPELREIELNAELNARRLSSDVSTKAEVRQGASRLETKSGVGAESLKDDFKDDLSKIFSQITLLKKLAKSLDVDQSSIQGVQEEIPDVIAAIQKISVDDVRTRGESSEVATAIAPALAVLNEVERLDNQLSKAEISPRLLKVIPSLFNQLNRLAEMVSSKSIDSSAIETYRDNIKAIVEKAAALQPEALLSVGTDNFDEPKIDNLIGTFTLIAERIQAVSLLPAFEVESKDVVGRIQGLSAEFDLKGVKQAQSELASLLEETVKDQEKALSSKIKPAQLVELNKKLDKRVTRIAEISDGIEEIENSVSRLDEISAAESDLSKLKERVELIGGDNDAVFSRIDELQNINSKVRKGIIEKSNLIAIPEPAPSSDKSSTPESYLLDFDKSSIPEIDLLGDVLQALNDSIANLESDVDGLLGDEFKTPLEFGEKLEPILAEVGEAALGAAKETISALSTALSGVGAEVLPTIEAIATSEEAKQVAFQVGQGMSSAVDTVKSIAQETAPDGAMVLASDTHPGMIQSASQLVEGAKVAGSLLIAGGVKAAEGLEFAAFSMVPGGALAKDPLKKGIQATAKHIALPAATFAAASHIPAVAPIAEMANTGMVHLIAPMVQHLSGATTEALIHGAQAAQATIQSAVAGSGVPGAGVAANVTGNVVNAMVQPVVSTATAAINTVAEVATSGIAQAATAIAGGKTIEVASKKVAEKVADEVSGAVGNLLPGASSIKALPSATVSPLEGTKTSEAIAIDAGQISQESLVDDGLSRAKAIGKQFEENYKNFKEALTSGDSQLIDIHSETITRLAESAKGEVSDIVATLKAQGVDVRFASAIGSKLNNIKGQLTRKQSLAKKLTKKAQTELANASDVLDVGSQSLDRIDIDGLQNKITDVLAQYGFNPGDSFSENVRNAVLNPNTRDLIVEGAANLGGTVASQMDASGVAGLAATVATRTTTTAVMSALESSIAIHSNPDTASLSELQKLVAIAKNVGSEMITGDIISNILKGSVGDLGGALGVLADGAIDGSIPMESLVAGVSGGVGLTRLQEIVTDRLNTLTSGSASRELDNIKSQSLERKFNEDGDRLNTRENRDGVSDEEIANLKELDRLLQQVEKHADVADEALNRIDAQAWDEFNESSRGLNEQIEAFGRVLEDPISALKELDKTMPALQLIPDWVKSIGGALGALGVLTIVDGFIGDFVDGSFEAALNFEKLENTFKFVTGSAGAAADQIKRIREEANAIGTDASQGLEGFAQLASSSRGTSLEGAATEQLSSAIQQAASVSQLDGEGLSRANTAVSQIVGKGKPSTEELRQQLGEVGGVFSGSFAIAARALGATTSELDKMLQRGEILSEEFLPKFAQQLSAETASGVAGAAKSAQASINRFNNSMTELKESFGAPLIDIRKTALGIGVDVIGKLVDLAPIATSLIVGLIAKLSIDIGGGLLTAVGGLEKLKGLFSGSSFADFDIDSGKGNSFGDRVFDKGIEIGKIDVGDVATSGLQSIGKQADSVKAKLMSLKESASEALSPFRGMSLDSVTGDQLSRGGVGPLSMLSSAPSFGDVSFDELMGKADISAKTINQRFTDSFAAVKMQSMVARDSAIASFTAIKVNATASAIAIQKRVVQSALTAGASFKVMARNATVGFLNISKAAFAAGASLLKAMAPMLLLSAAFEVVGIAKNAFSDLSGEIGGFSEQATLGFEAFTDAVNEANNSIEKLATNTRKLGEGDNLFTGSLIESIIGNSGAELLENALTQVVAAYGSGKTAKAFGRDGIRSFAERQRDDRTISTNELFSQVNQSLSASYGSDVANAVAEVNAIDKALTKLQAQKRNTGDAREKEAVSKDIDALIKQRATHSKVVGTLQANLADEKELIEQVIKSLNSSQANDPENASKYQRQIEMAKKQLEDIADRQDHLTNSIKASLSASALFAQEFAKINAIAEDSRMAADLEDAKRKLDVAIASSGQGSTVVEQINTEADIASIKDRLAINDETMLKIAALLEDDSVAQAFEVLVGKGITRDMNANDLLQALEKEPDTDEVEVIRTFAENTLELSGLQAETISLDTELATAQNGLRQQAKELAIQYRDLSREISDFYRDAYRSAEDVAHSVVSQDFQNATQEISNNVKRELLGLEKSFVSGIGDTFTGLIESLRQPLLDELDAINERDGIQRGFEDAMRSARDMQRQADEFDFEAGFGADPNADLQQAQGLSHSQQAMLDSGDYLLGENGTIWPKVIDLTAEQAFGGGSFLGESSFENTSPNYTPLQAVADTNGTIAESIGTNLRNDDIAAAAELAVRSRDEQLTAIDRNLATQADAASLEVDRALTDIARQLEEGRDTIAEQSDNFTRSLRDGFMDIGDASPMRELERSLLGVSDQFEDTNKNLENFKDGLRDTITETTAVRDELLTGVAAGAIGQEALAMLPELDRTIAQSQAALTTADAQIDESRNLLNAQRAQIIEDFEKAERDRRKAAQRRIVEGRGAVETARIDNFRASPFRVDRQRMQERSRLLNQAEQESISIAFEFDDGLTELDEMLRAGELTKLEYSELKEDLVGLNEIKLDGIRHQFESLLPTVETIVSALSSARGEFNKDAFSQIQDNLRLAAQSGALTNEQSDEARDGLRQARSIALTRGDNEAIRALMNEDNAFTSQFLSQIGRGDLVGIAELGIQNREAERARGGLRSIETDPQALSNELTRPELAKPSDPAVAFTQGSDRMVAAMEKLTMAIAKSGDGGTGGGVSIGQQVIQVTRDEEDLDRAILKKFNMLLDQEI